MQVIKDNTKLNRLIRNYKQKGKSIGFVPTMGALHEGHLSLIQKARKERNIVVVSIFVNPIQFGPKEDLNTYPRTYKKDVQMCRSAGVDFIFYPEADAMYPADYLTYVEVYDLPDRLCGKFRPGHFRGVTTIVLKLFNIVMPDTAYFGLKDYQQYVIIKKMIKDLNLPVQIKGLPTIREKDGLAKSSRNKYLSPAERSSALKLSKALFDARDLIIHKEKDLKKVKNCMYKILLSDNNIKKRNIDYISLIEPDTLSEKDKITLPVVIALAVRIGKTRLIDNIIIE